MGQAFKFKNIGSSSWSLLGSQKCQVQEKVKSKKVFTWGRGDSVLRECLYFTPNGPELLESLKLWGERQMAPPSELTNYNPNAKINVALYSQPQKLTI